MTIKDFQHKLYKTLDGTEWDIKLRMFLLSQHFTIILEQLLQDAKNNKRFSPPLKELFAPFKACPYSKLKVVFINGSPYGIAGVDDGLAFSCGHSNVSEKALTYMFKEIERTTFKHPDKYDGTLDLTHWGEQGVLLLNVPMTMNVKDRYVYTELWQPFYEYLFEYLATFNNGIIYVFFGNNAKVWHGHIGKNNYKFFVPHPITAHSKEENIWDSGNLFNQINKVLDGLYGETIKW